MKSDSRPVFFLFALWLTMLVAGLESPSVWAQDEPLTEEENAAPAAITQSERLRQRQQVIEADKEKLTEIKEDLADREALFDKLAGQIEQGEDDLDEKKAVLEELGGPDASEEATALAAEIESFEALIKVAKTQSEITFQSAKTLQGQIEALQQKIESEENSLEEAIGPSVGEMDEKAAATTAPPPEATATPGLSPAQLLMPGAGTKRTEAQKPAVARPETAEQIEARREAEKAEGKARKAEAAVVSFVERKDALENQIEMEQQLLQTAKSSRDNLDLAENAAQAELERLIGEGASKSEMQEARTTIETIQALQSENREEIDQRREYLDSLHGRLASLHEEQLTVSQEADVKRSEAEAARKKSVWLESPLHPRNLWRWFSNRGPRMLLVVIVAWALLVLVRFSARGLARTVVGKGGAERLRGANRADTLALSFRSAVSLFIVVAGVLLVFQEAGVDVKTVLGGAAILGIALAFGAQNLMRDYFTGFMILLEDQYELGDLITIGGITGRVEKVNMRTTVLRDIEGRVHFIPNGEIKSVTNRTYVWGRAVLELPISYKEDVDRVMEVILEVAEEFRNDPEMGDWVTDVPVMLGVDKFTESGVVIKFMVQTKPDKIFATRRQLLRRVKKRFDQEGIEISVPHRILIQEKGGDAPT